VTTISLAARLLGCSNRERHPMRALDESIVSLSGLLYLHKVQLDRSCAAEN
jgi:hypothetical protein